MRYVQTLMKHRTYVDLDGQEDNRKPVLPTKFKSSSTCQHPLCAACQLAKGQKRSTKTKVVKQKVAMKMKEEILQPVQMVSSDQYVSQKGGRLPHTYGRER